MSEYGTSSPSTEQIRLYLIRPPSATCTWRNEMSFSSVAENTLIGIVTIPNEMAPFQIACIAISSLSAQAVQPTARSVGGQQIGNLLRRVPQQVFTLARVEREKCVVIAILRRVPELSGLPDDGRRPGRVHVDRRYRGPRNHHVQFQPGVAQLDRAVGRRYGAHLAGDDDPSPCGTRIRGE